MPLNMEAEISMRSFRMFIALCRGATQEQLAMFSTQTGDLTLDVESSSICIKIVSDKTKA